MDDDDKPPISGRTATKVAMEAAKRGPIRVDQVATDIPVPPDGPQIAEGPRRAPPRLRKPSPLNDQCLAPTVDLEGHRARLREAFGNTMSDEFVEVILGKLIEALRPSPFDQLDEPTLNAGLALIHSIQPRSEMEALMAVQIVATGFSGLRFLRQSHRQMTKDFIDVYGGFAIKLLRLQNELIQALDRHRRGNSQMVEVQHVHLYPGSQGVVGIVNPPRAEGAGQKPCLLLHAIVHPADIQDRDGGVLVMTTLFGMFPFLKTLFADGGYQGPQFAHALAKALPHLDVEIVKRSDRVSGFVVLPKRWIVERSIAWLNRCRRLAKDWENLNRKALAFLRLASIRLMLRKLCNPA